MAAFALAFTVHHDFPYNQLERKSLVAPFQSSMLSGLVSESHHVKIVDSVVNYVTENTTEVDSIFSFPDFTALNFLVSRPAWGNVQWYLKAEFNLSMAQEAVEHLRRSPPSLAVVRSHWKWQSPAEKPYSYARLRREWIIINALEESLTKVDSIGPFYIMRPRSDFGSVSSGHSDTLSGYALSGRPSSRISFESTGIRPDGQ